MSNLFNQEDDMDFEEKDLFWNLLFEKVSRAISRREDFALVFQISEIDLSKQEEYSIIIHSDQYKTFLENFLLWSEENERYELCLETKKIIKDLELWKTKN